MNSFLQCLYMTLDFRSEICELSDDMHKIQGMETTKNSLYELYRLFWLLNSSSEEYIVPEDFRKSVPEPFCSSSEQQDVSEFGKFFMDDLETNLKKANREVAFKI